MIDPSDLGELQFRPGVLEGKRCLLAGATGGIGGACAALLALAGARLVLVGRNEAAMDQLKQGLAGLGIDPDGPHGARVVLGDVLQASTAKDIEANLSDLGGLDIVVNAIGVGWFESFHEARFERLMAQLHVNIGAAIRLAQLGIPHLSPSRGIFVQIASGLAHTGRRRTAAYTASQHALAGLLQSLRMEYSPSVRFSLVSVGGAGVRTAFWERAEPRIDKAPMMAPNRVADAVMNVVLSGDGVVVDDVRLRTP